ncbi:MAG TPA: hypothetical protein VGM90_08555 [Kofleriaceae bacterium]|jgi:hypothetical protein
MRWVLMVAFWGCAAPDRPAEPDLAANIAFDVSGRPTNILFVVDTTPTAAGLADVFPAALPLVVRQALEVSQRTSVLRIGIITGDPAMNAQLIDGHVFEYRPPFAYADVPVPPVDATALRDAAATLEYASSVPPRLTAMTMLALGGPPSMGANDRLAIVYVTGTGEDASGGLPALAHQTILDAVPTTDVTIGIYAGCGYQSPNPIEQLAGEFGSVRVASACGGPDPYLFVEPDDAPQIACFDREVRPDAQCSGTLVDPVTTSSRAWPQCLSSLGSRCWQLVDAASVGEQCHGGAAVRYFRTPYWAHASVRCEPD